MPKMQTVLVLISALCFGQIVDALEILVTPDCLTPTSAITLVAYEAAPPPSFLASQPAISRSGNVFKIVLDASSSAIGVSPPSSKSIPLGLLSSGSYHVDAYVRYQNMQGGFGEETLGAVKDFVVAEAPPVCAPARVEVISGEFQFALLNSPFPLSIGALVVDGQGRPVSGIPVEFYRVSRPEEIASPSLSQPSATFVAGSTAGISTVVSGTDGIARVAATANGAGGTVQYAARIRRNAGYTQAYFILSNRTQSVGYQDALIPVVEFYNAARDHYFMTADRAEMALLDSNQKVGWIRTGGVFLSLSSLSQVTPTNAASVCRYYGRPEAGLDSHFFSASVIECQEVQAKFPNSWILETADAFRSYLPNVVTGACASESIPLYRAFNNRIDANHRYALSPLVFQGSGWIREGYGDQAVAMCVPE